MTKDYSPRAFWNERLIRYGHTGEVDSLLYAYDQPLRLRAIDKVLSCSKVRVDVRTKILDIGCGTGDLISLFMKKGVLDIHGIDISNEVINYAKRRFTTSGNVSLHVMEAENMDFPSNVFDLVTSINVLQHIIDEKAISRAVKNIVRVVKPGGHILIMEFSPIRVRNKKPASYIIIRLKKEYIEAFENNECRLILEFALPRIGVRLWRAILERAIIKLTKFLSRRKKSIVETKVKNGQTKSIFSSLLNLVKVTVLKLAKPFDYFLMPFPSRFTDMRILIFEKGLMK